MLQECQGLNESFFFFFFPLKAEEMLFVGSQVGRGAGRVSKSTDNISVLAGARDTKGIYPVFGREESAGRFLKEFQRGSDSSGS